GQRFVTWLSYNARGLPDTITYPAVPGWPTTPPMPRVQTVYDNINRPVTVNLCETSADACSGTLSQVTARDVEGRVTSTRGPNYQHDDMFYDAGSGLLMSIQVVKNDGTKVVNRYYTYNPDHNLRTRTDVTRNLTETFTYDLADRLNNVSISNGQSIAYVYDVR